MLVSMVKMDLLHCFKLDLSIRRSALQKIIILRRPQFSLHPEFIMFAAVNLVCNRYVTGHNSAVSVGLKIISRKKTKIEN